MGLLNTTRLNNLKKAFRSGEIEKAYGYAVKLDITQVKTVYDLTMIAETYLANNKIGKAIEIYIVIFKKNKSSKICKTIIELCISAHDVKSAVIYMKDLRNIDEDDSEIFLYEYKIGKIISQPDEYLIECLKKYKEVNYVDKWALELAKLYYKNDMTEDCEKECQSIKLWFAETSYANKADVLMEACHNGKKYSDMMAEKSGRDGNNDVPDIFAQTEDYDSGLSEDEINKFMADEEAFAEISEEFEGEFDDEFDGDCGDADPQDIPEEYSAQEEFPEAETFEDPEFEDEEFADDEYAEDEAEEAEFEDSDFEDEEFADDECAEDEAEEVYFDEGEFEGDFENDELFEGEFDEEDEFELIEDEEEKELREEYYRKQSELKMNKSDKEATLSSTHEMTEISFESDEGEYATEEEETEWAGEEEIFFDLSKEVQEVMDEPEAGADPKEEGDSRATLINDTLTHDVIKALREQDKKEASNALSDGRDLVDEAIEKMMKEDDENE